MCLDLIRAQLQHDEGYRLDVYADRYGNPTVGIGHKVVPEDGLAIGDTILPSRVDDLFNADLDRALQGVASLIPNCTKLPTTVYVVLVNMCFNLGAEGLGGFKNFLYWIGKRNWAQAGVEMKNSDWYKQVGERAIGLTYEVMTTPLDKVGVS